MFTFSTPKVPLPPYATVKRGIMIEFPCIREEITTCCEYGLIALLGRACGAFKPPSDALTEPVFTAPWRLGDPCTPGLAERHPRPCPIPILPRTQSLLDGACMLQAQSMAQAQG